MIKSGPITIRSSSELEALREAGRIVAEIHAMIRSEARPGITTGELDRRGRPEYQCVCLMRDGAMLSPRLRGCEHALWQRARNGLHA